VKKKRLSPGNLIIDGDDELGLIIDVEVFSDDPDDLVGVWVTYLCNGEICYEPGNVVRIVVG